MSIEKTNEIDIIAADKTAREIHLTMTDPLPWDEQREKLLKLQDKINTYLAYIKSGDVAKRYPETEGFQPVIRLASRHQPNQEGLAFLAKVKLIIEHNGAQFEWRVVEESNPKLEVPDS